ncbi:MAG TPA: O-antigen ligase family protein [Noviherbaspirillum sp.]|uniref:O-antigen ligase family protein n=1 Tax=Noviherbaspirillum sp. TaxID=1926288 RepID=UPI002B495FD4|nr:O-antigen ligase family protein [Noviherbaspirillum sp.]HJV84333.1 O-antigen ligase family protein [Noviherbaspirillum sp.]
MPVYPISPKRVPVPPFVSVLALWSLAVFPLTFVFPFEIKVVPYLALLAIAVHLLRTSKEVRTGYGEMKPVVLAFGLYLPYSLLGIWIHKGIISSADNGVHLLYFLGIAACFAVLPSRRLFWCGLSAAAIGAGALAIFQRVGLGIDRPYGMFGINALGLSGSIKFGMVTTVFTLLALQAALDGCLPRRFRLWHAAGVLVGLGGCLVIGSRGPWLALLVVGSAIAGAKVMLLDRRRRLIAAGITVLLLALLFALFHEELHERYVFTVGELSVMRSGDLNTSIGGRLVMWKAAWALFLAHPIVGVGMNQFGPHLREMVALGQAPEFVAIFSQTHNEYLEALATGGLIGIAYLLWLFFAPTLLFLRHLSRPGFDANAATGGLIVIASFALFAVSDNVFDRQVTTSLFAFLTLGFAMMVVQKLPVAASAGDGATEKPSREAAVI